MKNALIVLGILILGILMLPAIIKPPGEIATEAPLRAKALATALNTALLEYREKNGQFPEGEPGQVIDALRDGGFFEPERDALNDHGELLDPWGTPFRITFAADDKTPTIESAGPNLIFEKGHPMSFISSDDYSHPR